MTASSDKTAEISVESGSLGARPWFLPLILLAASALALTLYVAAGARYAGNFGFPLDDSWIHLQIARNVARGLGWAYNPAELTGAATAPLWVALLIPIFWVRGDPTVWVKVLGSLLYLADVFLVADLARRLTGDWRAALVAGLLTAWQPTAVWAALSGMEAPLYLLLALLGIRSLLQTETRASRASRSSTGSAREADSTGSAAAYACTAWLTLAGWARPELWGFIPLAWAYLVYISTSEISPRLLKSWVFHIIIAGAGIGAFMAFNMTLWGHPFPSTLPGKAAFFQVWAGLGPLEVLQKLVELSLRNIQTIVNSQNPLAVICVGAAVVEGQRSRSRLGITWLALAVLLVVFIAAATPPGDAAFQTYRRTAHAIALIQILAAIGLIATWDRLRGDRRILSPTEATTLKRRRLSHLKTIFLAAAILLLAGIQYDDLKSEAKLYAQATRSINQGDVAAARWVAANLPADALVAVNDIGALAYFGERRILDLAGLATPEVIPILAKTTLGSIQRDRGLQELLLARKADYAVIFPSWYPTLSRARELVEIKRFSIPNPVALASDTIVVYHIQKTEQ